MPVKTIMVLLISFVLAAPLIAMGADDLTPCFGCANDKGPTMPSEPVWKPSHTVEIIESPEFAFGGTGNLEIYMFGQFAAQFKVLVFRWADGMKCFDFAYLRDHKQFKEIPCQ